MTTEVTKKVPKTISRASVEAKVVGKKDLTSLTKDEACAMLGVSKPTLDKYIEERGLPIASGGGQKGVAVLFNSNELYKWGQQQAKPVSDDDMSELQELKLLQERLKTKILEERYTSAKLANDTLVGGLYPADIVEELWSSKIHLFSNSLYSLAPKLAFKLSNISDSISRKKLFEREFDALLQELSNIQYAYDKEPWKAILESSTTQEDEANAS